MNDDDILDFGGACLISNSFTILGASSFYAYINVDAALLLILVLFLDRAR